MLKVRHSLLTKQIVSVLIAGILLTVAFVYIESNMFVDILFQQQGSIYEEMGRYARESVDVILKEAKSGLVQLSIMSGLTTGEKALIAEDLKKCQESAIQWFRRTYYIDAEGEMYSSAQVDLEVLRRTMDYDLPRRITEQAPLNGSIRFSEVYRSNMITDHTVAMYRKVHDGTVMAELDLETISSAIAQALGTKTIQYVLYTRSGGCVCGNLQDVIGPAEIWKAVEADGNPWVHFSSVDGRRLRFYSQTGFQQCDWTLTIILDETEVYASLWQLIRLTVVTSSALMLAVIVFLSIIASHFVRPIRKLSRQMERIELKGTKLNGFEPVLRNDEIGELSNNIQKMLRRINSIVIEQEETRHQQYEAELRALQYQLRPHFLYNTLNMLSALAVSHQEEKIPHAVSALVHILLVSTDKVGPTVTLREEIQCAREFMHIIALRYGNQIDLSIRVPEGMGGCILPKLILQPIIENSVFHGCVPSGQQSLIAIQCEEDDGTLTIAIMDNGVGMSQERIEEALNPGKAENLKPTGLANVESRLRLYFGDAYGLHIDSEPNVGTRVTVCLPKMNNIEEWREKIK